jgi:hypothetical protein
MFEKVIAFIKASQAAQIALALLVGMAIGALFYPTKHIEERLDKLHQEEISSVKSSYEKQLQTEKENYTKLSQEYNEYHKTTESKISSLTSEVSTLKSHQKVAYYKIVKPDGTIEERQFTETDIDESKTVITSIQQEFKEKVDSIEKKWEQVHLQRVAEIKKEFAAKEEDYKKTIDQLHQEKVVDINKKSFGLEVGGLLNGNYYGHITYDVFGPFFLGAQGEFGPSSTAGLGVGLRF